MSYEYEKVETPRGALRLHLNENTSGCSIAVLQALRQLTCEEAAFYPDYSEAIAACAAHFRVNPTALLLTNGLDEGILASSVTALRGSSASDPFEAIVVVPAFDMYAACADAAGGRVVEVRQGADFEFPLGGVLDAVTPLTRIVFITDPNNPTGRSVPRDSILRIAAAAPHALVFVDEAYADFRGTTLIGDLRLLALRNVVIGRTFAKAHGLAAMRIGALIGAPPMIDRIRRAVPPYSVNLAAATALPVALRDRAHFERYLDETRRSKELLYGALDRLGIRYWRSDANFVLVHFGSLAGDVIRSLAARGIHVRDRGKDHGCAGCVRITTGIVLHTERAIGAIEEILCAAR